MKNFIFLLALIAISHSFVFSQGCLPEGIIFTTQEEIDNFQTNYPGCTEIEGDLTICGADITNLSGLENLISIDGSLFIGDWGLGNPLLNSIISLGNLLYIGGGIQIMKNPSLIDLEGLENITFLAGSLSIGLNENLTNLTGLNNLAEVSGDLLIQHTNLANFEGLEQLTLIGNDFVIYSNDSLVNFTGLNNLTAIYGKITIDENPVLVNFLGLENLSIVGSDTYINNNVSLQNLNGLNNLDSIGGYLNIFSNPILNSLNGLNNLTTIENFLRIHDNMSLLSLQALSSLTQVLGFTISFNNLLTTMTGLDSINSDSIVYFEIVYNDLLSACDVLSVCEYILIPSVSFYIIDNAPGCNTPEEVQLACLNYVEDRDEIVEISLFPNPASSFITFVAPQSQEIEEIIFYNQLGQVVLSVRNATNPINISNLSPGIYFAAVRTSDRKLMTKVFIE